jgi:hypothetical protein
MRKKTNKESVIENILNGFYISPVKIYRIGNGLKGEERYSDRKYEFVNAEPGPKKRIGEL